MARKATPDRRALKVPTALPAERGNVATRGPKGRRVLPVSRASKASVVRGVTSALLANKVPAEHRVRRAHQVLTAQLVCKESAGHRACPEKRELQDR